jgi:hypothetical protein
MKVLYPVNVEDGDWSLIIDESELKEVKGEQKGGNTHGEGKNLREGMTSQRKWFACSFVFMHRCIAPFLFF